MRTPIPFDTHAFVKQLTAAGIPEAQAEVHARAIADLVNDQLTTKQDLEASRLALQRDLETLRIGVQRDIAELEARLRHSLSELELRLRAETERLIRKLELRLTLRLGGIVTAGIAIVATLVQVL